MTPKRNDPATAPQDLSALMRAAAHGVAGMMTLPWLGGTTVDIDSGKIYAVSYGTHGPDAVRVSMDNEARMDFEIDFDLFRAMLKEARAGAYVDFRTFAGVGAPENQPENPLETQPQKSAAAPDEKKGRLTAVLRRL